jgi:hypothetical protein
MRNQSSWVVVVNDIPYVVDCGGGGALIYNAWVSGFKGRIDSWGPPSLDQITKSFFHTNLYDINIRIPDEERPRGE